MNWPSYLIQVNIYLILFYAFYELLLKNETFFNWNRTFLVGSGIFSFVIPAIQSDWVKSMFVTKEIEEVTYAIAISPVVTLNAPVVVENNLSLMEWASIIYLTGVLFFFFRLIWQLFKVKKSFREGSRAQSFFMKIKVSEDVPSRESIVKHEKVHASQLHSADVIFFELISIINWFNPVVYAYKRSVKFIHEFIADAVASSEKGKSEYALILVSSAFGIQKEQLTNNFFNQSLLKKRIMMLHKTKSRRTALLKYGLAVPLFAVMVIFSSATIKKQEVKVLKEALDVANILNLNVEKQETTNMAVESVASQIIEADKTNANTGDKIIHPNAEDKIETAGVHRDSSIFGVSAVEVMPSYPGGMGEFYKWVGKEFKYPKSARDAGVSGRVTVTFVVEKDGALNNIKVLKDLGHGTGEEVMRVLSISRKWKPGMQNGKPVRVQYTLPLMLQIESNKKESEDKQGSITPNQNNNPIFRAGSNPVILIDGKRLQREVPAGFNFGAATEAEYAELLGINPSDIKTIAVTKNEDGSSGTLSITTKAATKEHEAVLGKADASKILSLRLNGSDKEEPLYILNGKPITSKEMKKISPANIEAISVLKDDKAAPYGEKGKNGVVIITSKK